MDVEVEGWDRRLVVMDWEWGPLGTKNERVYIKLNTILALLVQWTLYKYKCLWGVGIKGRDSSLQKRVSHVYVLRLD